MYYLIGFIMTQFPFATAAQSLTTDAAREAFARPDYLSRYIELGRTGRRARRN